MIFGFFWEKEKNQMKIKMLPAEERPVEKAVKYGASTLSNAELLAVLLGSGTREKSAIGLAEEILSRDQSGISYLSDCTIQELTGINGVGDFKAVRILCAIELGKRIATKPKNQRLRIDHSDEVASLFMENLRYEKKENFLALLLSASGDIISIETISIGELTNTPVHPREAFRQAIKKSAAAVVFVHNHPSGDPNPSMEDYNTTRRLVECGKLLGIKVLDHLVIGGGTYVSIAGLIDM